MAKVNANVELSNSFVVGGVSVAAAGLCWVHFSKDGKVLTALKKQVSAWGNLLFAGKSPETPRAESKSDDDDDSLSTFLCFSAPQDSSRENKKSPCGLANLGSTSYMNSLLQCLFHTEELVNVIVSKDTNPSSASSLAECFSALMRAVRNGEDDRVDVLLNRFKQLVYQTDSDYLPDHEYDAHEFFITLRDALNEEYGTEKVFRGKILNERICPQCGDSDYFRDDFQELQLDILPSYNLNEILVDYLWNMDATFTQLPPVLVFQLKRFKNNLEKNQAKVGFPVQLKVTQTNNKRQEVEKNYSLYAVCYHLGELLHTGHYTASCKNDGIWYSFSDSEVKRIGEPAAENAYLLFYSSED